MEGIIAVRPDGRIVGANRSALEQLGMSGATLRMQSLESLFNTSVGSLVDRFRSPLATPLAVRTALGRQFHLHARFDWPVWSSLAEAVAAQVPGAAMVSPALRAAAAIAASLQPAAAIEPAVPLAAPLPMPLDAHAAAMVDRLCRALEHNIPSVVVGETGCGKEWLARTAHQHARPGRPFVALACAGMPPEAIESALVEGVLGDDGAGTLYLDEIGDLAPQASSACCACSMHAATKRKCPRAARHRDCGWYAPAAQPLRALVDAARLREDLFYRLNGLTLRAPPLRERSDLIDLALAIVEQRGARQRHGPGERGDGTAARAPLAGQPAATPQRAAHGGGDGLE